MTIKQLMQLIDPQPLWELMDPEGINISDDVSDVKSIVQDELEGWPIPTDEELAEDEVRFREYLQKTDPELLAMSDKLKNLFPEEMPE